jgi:hypothetical protein
MDVFKCAKCGCRWVPIGPTVGVAGWRTLNDKQRPYECCNDERNLRLIEHLDPMSWPTRFFDLDGAWKGETAAVIGHAPKLTAEQAQRASAGMRRVAVNQAISLVPDADLFVALDPHHPFWDRVVGFEGIKIFGLPYLVGYDYDLREHNPYYAGMMYERVFTGAGQIEIRNNFIAALRVVELLGVSKVVLLGLDADEYDRRHAHTGFFGFAPAVRKVVAEFRAKGIEVEEVA